MDDVETRFNKEPRNVGFFDEAYGADVFGHGVRFTSAAELVYDEGGLDQMAWYVVNNYSQVEEYIKYVITYVLCYMLPSSCSYGQFFDTFFVFIECSGMN